MLSSLNNSVGFTKLFDKSSVSYTELRSNRIKIKWPYMVNLYHQKTFMILKSNVISKSNAKILQYKQNIWKKEILNTYRTRDI